jgi:uncharacterized glyoxalase superfamily protein PhnB
MHVPAQHNAVSPYLHTKSAAELIAFLEKVFDAKRVMQHAMPDGRVMHAEVRIGDTIVMMGESPEPMNAMVHVYVPDVDKTFERAVAAGATSLRKPETMFYGDRISMVKDAFGTTWAISTHVEDVSDEEMKRRMAKGP